LSLVNWSIALRLLKTTKVTPKVAKRKTAPFEKPNPKGRATQFKSLTHRPVAATHAVITSMFC